MYRKVSTALLATTTAAALSCLVATARPAHAGTSVWSALTGLTPDRATPPYAFTSAGARPTLQSGFLQWTPSTHGDFQQVGAAQIAMPSLLVIETQMQFISGTTSNSSRSGAQVYFTTGASVGNSLYIESGDIFLNNGNLSRGPSATLDTTSAFHTYRLEVNTTSGAIAVFYDNGAAPVLTGATYTSASDHGSDPRVGFGDGSSLASGTSRWVNFQHNASAAPEPGSAALLATALPCLGAFGGLIARRRRSK